MKKVPYNEHVVFSDLFAKMRIIACHQNSKDMSELEKDISDLEGIICAISGYKHLRERQIAFLKKGVTCQKRKSV